MCSKSILRDSAYYSLFKSCNVKLRYDIVAGILPDITKWIAGFQLNRTGDILKWHMLENIEMICILLDSYVYIYLFHNKIKNLITEKH